MDTAFAIAFHVVLIGYAAAAVLFFLDLAAGDRFEAARRHAPRVLGGALTLHAGHILVEVLSGAAELGSPRAALSLCGAAVAAAYLVLRTRMRIDAVGVAAAPVALTLYVASEFLRGSGAAPGFPPSLLLLHVVASVLGVAFFLLAGAAGAFYLVQERRLKAKRAGALKGRLPALDALDLTEHRLLLAGFPLLTFGIVTGAVFAARLDALGGVVAARAILAYATWMLVAGVLVLRAVAGWRGRRSAYGTLAGVLCILVVVGIYAVRGGGSGGL